MSSSNSSIPRSTGPQLARSALEAELEDLRRILESNVPLSTSLPRSFNESQSLPGSRGSPRRDEGKERGAATSLNTPRLSFGTRRTNQNADPSRLAIPRSPSPLSGQGKVSEGRFKQVLRPEVGLDESNQSPSSQHSSSAAEDPRITLDDVASSLERSSRARSASDMGALKEYSSGGSSHRRQMEPRGSRGLRESRSGSAQGNFLESFHFRPEELQAASTLQHSQAEMDAREGKAGDRTGRDWMRRSGGSRSSSSSSEPFKGSQAWHSEADLERQSGYPAARVKKAGSFRNGSSAGGMSDGGSVDLALGDAEGVVNLAFRRASVTAAQQRQQLSEALASKEAEVKRMAMEAEAVRAELEGRLQAAEAALAARDADLRASQAELDLANQKLATMSNQEPRAMVEEELRRSLHEAEEELATTESALRSERTLRESAEQQLVSLRAQLDTAVGSLREESALRESAVRRAEKERKRRKRAEALLAGRQESNSRGGEAAHPHRDQQKPGVPASSTPEKQPSTQTAKEGKGPAQQASPLGTARGSLEGEQSRKGSMQSGGREGDERGGGELEVALAAERKAREAAERWLRAELRHKAEMEQLFAVLRDIALGRSSDGLGMEAAELRSMMDELRAEQKKLLNGTRGEWDKAQVASKSRGPLVPRQPPPQKKAPPLSKTTPPARQKVPEIRVPLVIPKIKGSPSKAPLAEPVVLTKCLHCSERFNANANDDDACGYHPGELRSSGYTCCGGRPESGKQPAFCHWGPHVSR